MERAYDTIDYHKQRVFEFHEQIRTLQGIVQIQNVIIAQLQKRRGEHIKEWQRIKLQSSKDS